MSGRLESSLGTRIAKALAAACTVVIIMVVGLVDLSRTAPGPLSAVHGTLEELAGMEDCAACHGGWFGDMAGACLECHAGIGQDIEAGRGLHGTQPEGVEPTRCALCHGEHNGTGFQIAGPRSFAMAGIGSREDVDHARFGLDLQGGHLLLACVECHAGADREVLREGAPRFRGLHGECASCHESEHPDSYTTECSVCHDQESFEELSWPDHELVFPQFGAHADTACASCHESGTETSIDHRLQLLGRAGGVEGRTCVACHDVPHSRPFLARVAARQVDGPELTCVVCHDVERGEFATAASTMDRELHSASGFDLEAPHAEVSCDSCHGGATPGERPSGRTADQCASCHVDPHGGQFATGSTATTDCLGCHARTEFEPARFGKEQHDALDFRLEGAHENAECSKCHTAGAGPEAEGGIPSRKFRGTETTCSACHEDVHFDLFTESAFGGECSACHGVEDFAAYDASAFDHGVHCGFTLEGSHGQSECSVCHEQAKVADGAGRLFGRFDGFLAGPLAPAESAFDLSGDCALCHESPHGENSALDSSSSCAACHVPTSFRLAGDEFDHAATGFALVGNHAGQSCSACHSAALTPLPGRASHRSARAVTCAGCHSDPHGGQFDLEVEVGQLVDGDCARCHEPSRYFLESHFNHNFDSDFRLEGRHAELRCSACHAKEKTESGAVLTRYKPLSKDCAACHGKQEDGRLRKDG